MSLRQSGSLQLRLALRLGTVFLIATVMAAGMFFYLGNRAADALSNRDLFRQADDLADSLDDDHPPGAFEQLVERGIIESTTAFVIRDSHGAVIAATDGEFEAATENIDAPRQRPRYFRLDAFGSPPRTYSGLAMREGSELGRVSVWVAEPYDAEDALLGAMLDEIASEAAWIIPIFVTVTLLVGVFAIRGGLRPLRETARQAAAIRPERMSVRLDTTDLPSEITPMVTAVNQALDRLEEGFAVQRRFTATARP